MAIQVLAGIPWLAGVLAGLFAGLVEYLTKFLTKRLAIILAAVALIATLTAAFFLAINTAVGALVPSLPGEVSAFLSHWLPSNTAACIAVYLSCVSIRWVYEWNIKILRMKTEG